ncbi:MAG: hypothetical protein R3B46_01875 [Phycisphaerales bacterium]|nr:hypothetical protein [Phycisphaerales bacterium]
MTMPNPAGTHKPALEVVEMDPERLAWGVWDHKTQKEFGEGDIRASYSGDRIGMDQPVRRPFAWRGGLWIAASFEGIGGNTAEVYRLVDPGAFEGKPTTYREKTRNAEAARNDPLGFYHGMAVKCRGETFVLCGPPVLLIPASRVQLGLFDDDPPDA